MDESNLINLDVDYYKKLISCIFIGGWEENDIKEYEKKEKKNIKMKVMISIPFNFEFNNFDVYLIY